MTTVEEIRKKALSRYKDFLLEFLHSGNCYDFFPLEIKADKGKASDSLKDIRNELLPLIKSSKEKTGKGYSLRFEEVRTRSNGTQSVLKQIFFETENDFLTFIGKKKDSERFWNAAGIVRSKIRDSEVDIDFWLESHLNDLTSEREDDFWFNICECVNYLRRNRKPDLYLRQIPVKVHTKFIEENKKLIHSLITEEKIGDSFEKSHGLKEKPVLVRFRSLDENLKLLFCGMQLSETAIDIKDFEKIDSIADSFISQIKRIFIIENEIVYLTFPMRKNSICIWGHGFTAAALKNSIWLTKKELIYFGDLDEHGFEILSVFRSSFPNVKSFCMNQKTLDDFEKFRCAAKVTALKDVPENLTAEEKLTFEELIKDKSKNRLEQERLDLTYLQEKLNAQYPE